MKVKPKKTLTVLCLLALLCTAVAARIYYVNEHAPSTPVKTYNLNETVALEGAFAEYAYENTDGYLVRATKAERMSINEYIDLYSVDQSILDGYLEEQHNYTDRDLKTLVVVDLEIQNDKPTDGDRGYLDSIGWAIKSSSSPELWIRTESALLESSIPQAGGAFQLSVKPGTTYTVHIPFSGVAQFVPFPAPNHIVSSPELTPGRYSLVLTKGKASNVIDLGTI